MYMERSAGALDNSRRWDSYSEKGCILSSFIFMTLISGLIWMLQYRRDAQI